ncbi:MAG: hypothetical protein ABSA77_04315, partial [Thermoguttaceae bacterium]
MTKKGRIHAKSRRLKGLSHQTIPNNSTGKTAADPLLSIANKNAARLSQYQGKRWAVDGGQWAVSCSRGPPWERTGAMPTFTVGMAAFKYHKIDNWRNSIAVRFFREEIQATDST